MPTAFPISRRASSTLTTCMSPARPCSPQNADIKSQLSPDEIGISFAGYPVTPAQLVPLIHPEGAYSGTPFRIVVHDGKIVSMFGLFHP